jgi:hypothetical protein
MANPVLPAWEGDPLSTLLFHAQQNERISALNYPDVYEVLQLAHGLLRRIGGFLEADPTDPSLGVPRLLIARSHSAVLAAARLAMSGQGFEAQPVIRVAVEQAWYALHVAKDPTPPMRARIWWDRNVSPQATQACRDEFTARNVRRTHEGLDAATAAAMHRLYESAIDLGAHPNQLGVAGSLGLDRLTGTVSVGFLHAGTAAQVGALKMAADAAIGIAKMVGLIYPERLRIAGVHEDVGRLVRRSAEVFDRYAETLRRGR